MQNENRKKPMIEDIPFPLIDQFRMFWMPEEATREEKNLPESEQVQAFIQWCKKPGNVENLNEENRRFLEENGDSLTPSENPMMPPTARSRRSFGEMTYEELMSFAPKDCRPTIISRESILQEQAKRLNKDVSELTEEEKEIAFAPLNDPLDAYRD